MALINWIKTFKSGLLGFVLIMVLMGAGYAPRESRFGIGAGYSEALVYGEVNSCSDETSERYKAKHRNYKMSISYDRPSSSRLIIDSNLIFGIVTEDFFSYRYNSNEEASNHRLILKSHLDFDTNFAGIGAGAVFYLSQRMTLLVPELIVWIGMRELFLFCQILDPGIDYFNLIKLGIGFNNENLTFRQGFAKGGLLLGEMVMNKDVSIAMDFLKVEPLLRHQ